MDVATIFGSVVSLTLVLLGMETPTAFFNVPSVLIVVGCTFALMLFSFPLQNTLSAFRYFSYTVIPPKPGADNSKVIGELEIGIVYFEKMKSYAQATGWVGFLIGLILMLGSLSVPDAFNEPAEIGNLAAVALLTVLYGYIIAYFYCMPVSTKLQFRLDELKKAS
jgi:flagellar motor component MotA